MLWELFDMDTSKNWEDNMDWVDIGISIAYPRFLLSGNCNRNTQRCRAWRVPFQGRAENKVKFNQKQVNEWSTTKNITKTQNTQVLSSSKYFQSIKTCMGLQCNIRLMGRYERLKSSQQSDLWSLSAQKKHSKNY